MRAILVAGMMVAAGAAGAVEKAITFAELEANRPALAGEMVKVVSVTVFNFAENRGGLVRDPTGGAKLDDAGMAPRIIYHLERHCSRASATPPKPECQGVLTFKVTLREEFRGGFTIREAQFQPNRE